MYKRTITFDKGHTLKELKIKEAIGTLYASSPFLTKKEKDKLIDELKVKR
jgi:hypothetical protein